MFNIVFSDEYLAVPKLLAELRRKAGLSQRGLANILGRSQGHVQRMETGQRPIELVEFCRIARAADLDPRAALGAFLEAWEGLGLAYPCAAAPAVTKESRAA
jgi:transcriptional regulator with XRE-family HTH domain